MKFQIRSMLAVLLLAGAGCATSGGGKSSGGEVKPMTPAERQEAVQAYGEEPASDIESVMATTPRNAPILADCIGTYLVSVDLQKKGQRAARGHFKTCVAGCDKLAGGPHAALAAKYGGLCKQGYAGASSAQFVTRLKEKMEVLRESKMPDDWRKNGLAAEEVIQEAAKALGPDNADLKPLVEEYDTLMKAHKKDLDKVQGFNKRQDISAMRTEMGQLKLEIDSLGNRPRTDGGQALMMAKQRRYDDLKEKIDREARKAGIR
jgi:hypothetical protein